MKSQKSHSKWLDTAYQLFAEIGPDNLTIKELANICDLPRTNFYYHFHSKDELIDEVINLHFRTTTELFNIELGERLHVFIPDLYTVLYDFKPGLQFARSLFNHRHNPRYDEAYKKGVALSAYLIVPKFKEYFKIELPDNEVRELWFTLTDAWYSRLLFDNFSVDYMIDLCYNIMDTIKPLIRQGKTD